MTIEEILSKEENQTFDRKSINISPKDLAIPIVAFANADGGDIAIGITDKNRRIEGIDFETKKLNELLRVPFDFCNPTIKVGIEKVPCVDEKGRKNHVLVMHAHIPQLYLCYVYLRALCINGRITVVASSIDRDQPIPVFCHDLQSDRFFKDILDLIKRK